MQHNSNFLHTFRPIYVLMLFFSMITLSGCVEFRHKYSIVRFLVDVNSQNAPAITCERLSHEPAEPVRVDDFRWMYNRPVGKRVDEWQQTRSAGVAQISSSPVIEPMYAPPEAPLPQAQQFDSDVTLPPPAPESYPQSRSGDGKEPVAKSTKQIQRTAAMLIHQPVPPKRSDYSWLFNAASQK